MRRFPESMRGTGRVGCAIWAVLFVAIVYVLVKVVPVKMKTSQFLDAMTEQASFGSIKGDKSIHDELYRKARDLDLPIRAQDILVTRTPSTVTVKVHYVIPIDFLGHTYLWVEDRTVSRPLFLV
jgi:hypothetical protein